MIKYSIRRQMTAIFIGLFSLILGLVLIINNAFLGHYYLSHKADDLIRTYNDVNAKLESGSLSDSDSVRDILTQLECRITKSYKISPFSLFSAKVASHKAAAPDRKSVV